MLALTEFGMARESRVGEMLQLDFLKHHVLIFFLWPHCSSIDGFYSTMTTLACVILQFVGRQLVEHDPALRSPFTSITS